MSDYILSIDLGTSNSGIAINSKGSKEINMIPNDRGAHLTPSVVKFGSEEKIIVGKPALNCAITEPERVVREVKKHMGEEWNFKTPEGNSYSPEEISSYILKKLKSDAENHLNTEISEAVISHPARFGSVKREATRSAAELAGFKEIHLITEPEAAAFSEFKKGDNLDGNVIVADAGGGTTDVSILEISHPDIETKTIEGDLRLGGNTLTKQLVKEAEKEIGEISDPNLKQELYKRAEEAKIDLSDQEEVSFSIPTTEGLKHFKIERKRYGKIIRPFIQNMIDITKKALSNTEMTWENLDFLLLVGGTIKTPLIQRMFRDESGLEPLISPQPDKAIATGAAVKAASVQGENILTDKGELILSPFHNSVLSKSIGVKAIDGKDSSDINKIILEKDSPLPVEDTEIFTTEVDRQTNVGITLLEGESRKPTNCTILGKEQGHILEGIPPMPAGSPKIEVTLKIDTEGLLTTKAVDLDSGTPVEFHLKLPELLSGKEKQKSKEKIEASNIN